VAAKDKQTDDAPDTTKSARTAVDSSTKTEDQKAARGDDANKKTKASGEDAKDPLQSGALSTAGPSATAHEEPGKDQELDGTPTGSPPGVNVFPEHTAEDPEGILDYANPTGDNAARTLSPPKGSENPSKDQLYAEIFTVIRNELAADKPFLRDRIDTLIGKLGGPDRSSQATASQDDDDQ
jgi:hypothetical protein